KLIQSLTQLQSVDLSSNNIADISAIQSLTQLQSVYLSDNNIADISALQSLTQLQSLDLSSNKIVSLKPLLPLIQKGLPVKWGDDFQQNKIYVENNPLQHPSQEIIEQGNEAIVRYFEELEKGVDHIYEAKLLLVGEGGVGKTSLRLKLEDDYADLPDKDDRTRGIDIVRLPFRGREDRDFYMNIWDFGGQHIYHTTHHFFLTRRSFYVPLTETRRQDDNFDYWIPNIRLFGEDSPILIVKNLWNDSARNISIQRFQKQEGQFNIVDNIKTVNLKSGEGLQALKQCIYHHIQELPHVGDPVPKTWAVVRRELKKLAAQEPYISWERFAALCSEKGIDSKLKIQDLGKYLHDLGIVLWYHDIAALKSKVILQPEWATNAVYQFIDDSQIQHQNGHFNQKDVERIWCKEDYCDMHGELLALMKAFKLCYQKRNHKAYIIPSLLPADPQPPLTPPKEGNIVSSNKSHLLKSPSFGGARGGLRLQYQYTFMPKGLVNQLTAELHKYIKKNQVWGRGVILKREHTEAKIVENRIKRQVNIEVQGMNKKGLMEMVRNEIEEIHDSYPGIEVETLIPCPCELCQKLEKPTLFSYSKLIERLQTKGDKPVFCMESDEFQEIRDVLGAVGIALDRRDAIEGKRRRGFREKGRIEEETVAKPKKVFISYHEEDQVFADRLKGDLEIFERIGDIEVWYDRILLGGDHKENVTNQHLAEDDIILLLVSAAYIRSKVIWDLQLPKAIERHHAQTAKVIPIVLKPCIWEGRYTPFGKLQALPKGKNKTIQTSDDEDSAWMEVMLELKRVFEA
ncbi:MAG: COR domain-containing protein, partial [Chitinophagales bacterium]